MKLQDIKLIIASDVSDGRDGIGIELYYSGSLLLEIFRNDSKRTHEVTLHQQDVPLNVVHYAIDCYQREIPQQFIQA
ncbi:MAG: hypothetical protein ACPG8A_01230 [Psychrobium sp.]